MLFQPPSLPCTCGVRVRSAELQELSLTCALVGLWVCRLTVCGPQKWSHLAGVRMLLTALKSLDGRSGSAWLCLLPRMNADTGNSCFCSHNT